MPQKRRFRPGKVPLNRALSKLGILSRAEATRAVRGGRVSVDGAVVRDPAMLVVPERSQFFVDGMLQSAAPWRTILFHKPRGVVTTRRDPGGRPTIYDVLGATGRGLRPVGRLDLATSGLLILTSDTRLAEWITNPSHAVPRVYIVTVRGEVRDEEIAALSGPPGNAPVIRVRKRSARESHLIVELREGRNRQVRRLFEGIRRDVTKLKRVRFGGLELGALEPGAWRELSRAEIRQAFPGSNL